MKVKVQLSLLAMFLFSFGLFAQRNVSGLVTSSEDNLPIIGATVLVEGTTIGVATDANGKFNISVPNDKQNLVVSFIGMAPQTVAIGSSNNISVVLQPDQVMLNNVVVTALGIKREEKKLSYAVSQVGADDISRSGEQNTVQALAGKVAGVQVMGSGGTPGASSKITLRGISSITGATQPLIIIDGVPVDNSTFATGGLAGDNPFNATLDGVNNSNRLLDLNPEDIESVSVLKGPAAAAIYGTSAGNGAVLITTKKGSRNGGKSIGVTINSSIEFSQVANIIDLQNRWGAGNGGEYYPPADPGPDGLFFTDDDLDYGTPLSWGPRLDTTDLPKYDNPGAFFKTGVSFNNTVAISGGSEKANYRLSISNVDQNGVIPYSGLNRTTARLGADWDVTEKVTIGATAAYTRTNTDLVQNGSNLAGVMLSLYRAPITVDLSDYENEQGYSKNYYVIYDNPFYSTRYNTFNSLVNRFQGSANVNYKIHKWFTPSLRMGVDHYNDNRKSIFAVSSFGGFVGDGLGEIVHDDLSSTIITTDLMIGGGGSLLGENKITMDYRLGYGSWNEKFTEEYSRGNELAIPRFYDMSNASTLYADDYRSEFQKYSGYGSLDFGFASQFFVSLTGREDFASTFGPDTKNAFFSYSAGASWLFSELIKGDGKKFSYGKLRYSYSKTGIEPALYATKTYYTNPVITDGFTNGLGSPYGGNPIFGTSQIVGNSGLKPETVLAHELGLDLRFFENRLKLDVAFYNQTTKGNLIYKSVAPSSGYQQIYGNFAKLRNRGLEIGLDAGIVRGKKFTWDMGIVWSMNRNKVLDVEGESDQTEVETAFESIKVVAKEGYSVGSFQGSAWLRDDNGKIVVDADGYPIIDPEEQIIGDPTPKWLMGIRNTLSYKGLTLSFLFDVRYGGDIWNGTLARLNRYGRSEASADREKVYMVDGVYEDGTPNESYISAEDYFQYVVGDGGGATENAIEKNIKSLKLRDISLDYTFKFKDSPILIKTASIGFSMRNFLLWTNYKGGDPETSLNGAGSLINGFDYFNNPNAHSYLLNVKLGF